MRNALALRLIGSVGLVVATLASVTFLSSYDDRLRFLSTDPFVHRLPTIRYELRAEQTGEMYRGHIIDGDGLVRQVRVQFRDGRYGIKYTNGNGILVGVKEFLKDGSYIVYDLEPDGKTSNHQQWFSKTGVLMRDRKVGKDKAVEVTVFNTDGKTPVVVEQSLNGSNSKIFMYADGKPRAKFKLEQDGAVEFAVLAENGKTLYTETASADRYEDEEGGTKDIEVAVFGDNGVPDFKQFYRVDPGSQEARLVKAEKYSADGKNVVQVVEIEGDKATVTTTGADGKTSVRQVTMGEVPSQLVTEPTHPAKDIEPKLMDTFDFPLRAANMLN
jgi:hypothetical protein